MADRYALINADDSWEAGPLDDRPTPTDGQRVEIIPLNYPDGADWSPSDAGFVDRPAPMTLEEARAHFALLAEKIRDERVNGGCQTEIGFVDTDRDSRLNLSGSTQMAAIIGSSFTITWRLADNSYVTLDAPTMVAVGVAVGRFVGACYGASFEVKDAIAAATTIAEVEAVQLDAGYPN